MDQQFNEAIDFKEMYSNAKKRITLKSKAIKRMLLYNYLNDDIPSLIIDCRPKATNKLLSSQELDSKYKTANGCRIILILSDTDNLLSSQHLTNLREFIKNEDKITNGLFTIKESDYNDFLNSHKWYLTEKMVYERRLPLCVINDKLYMGSFIISKNKVNLGLLGIKSVISLMAEDDKDFVQFYGEHYRNFKHEEVNHDELDFNSIIEYIVTEIDETKEHTPMLIYCFSGQSASIAVCAAYLMATRKWSSEFAIGYMMKLSPKVNIPSWILAQLQKLKLNNFKKSNSS